MKPAKRMSMIPPSSTLRVLALAKELQRQGKDIVHMEVGEQISILPNTSSELLGKP